MKLPEVIEIAAIDAVEIAVEPWTWPFAQARRADIDRHFAAQQRERSALWNGRVLLLHRYARKNRVLRGASFETDYASFLAWRDLGLSRSRRLQYLCRRRTAISRRRLSTWPDGAVHLVSGTMGFSVRHVGS